MSAGSEGYAPGGTRVLCDAMLGSLARLFRMWGYDAAYAPDEGVEADEALAALADREDRLLVTRDRRAAGLADEAVLLESRDVDDQLRELRAAGFALSLSAPSRCGACNGTLDRVPVGDDTPADVPDPADVCVWRCRACGQHFWRGSHWDDVADRLRNL